MIGSMIIPNNLGGTTIIFLTETAATPPEALHDARVYIRKQKSSPTPSETMIQFLEAWINMAVNPPPIPTPAPVTPTPPKPRIPDPEAITPTPKPSITPPEKTSVKILTKGENKENASA